MSNYINEVRDAENETERKPVFRQFAIVVIAEENIDDFDKLMDSKNNRWDGRVCRNIDGNFIGWISYMARGANPYDMTRSDRPDAVAHLATVIPMERFLVWDEVV